MWQGTQSPSASQLRDAGDMAAGGGSQRVNKLPRTLGKPRPSCPPFQTYRPPAPPLVPCPPTDCSSLLQRPAPHSPLPASPLLTHSTLSNTSCRMSSPCHPTPAGKESFYSSAPIETLPSLLSGYRSSSIYRQVRSGMKDSS